MHHHNGAGRTTAHQQKDSPSPLAEATVYTKTNPSRDMVIMERGNFRITKDGQNCAREGILLCLFWYRIPHPILRQMGYLLPARHF